MNLHLENAITEIAKADALMSVMDRAGMEDMEGKAQRLFSAAWEAVKITAAELDRLAEDDHIVDIIYAVNDCRRRRGKREGQKATT